MRALVLWTAGLAAVVAAPAWAGDLVGGTAPEMEVKEFVQGNAPKSLKALHGKVVLLEFFATT